MIRARLHVRRRLSDRLGLRAKHRVRLSARVTPIENACVTTLYNEGYGWVWVMVS